MRLTSPVQLKASSGQPNSTTVDGLELLTQSWQSEHLYSDGQDPVELGLNISQSVSASR